MRAALFLVLLTGCPADTTGDCSVDSDCSSGDVCTRDASCTVASQVRSVKLQWTVSGKTASPASCVDAPELIVGVQGPLAGEEIEFAPVPCDQGSFNLDKLPTSYTKAELGIEGTTTVLRSSIDATNTAQFDLFP